jgi:hypothetical protein
VYNLDKLDPVFRSENDALKTEAEAAALHLRFIFLFVIVISFDVSTFYASTSAPLNRERLATGGIMVKSVGLQSTYGHSYTAAVSALYVYIYPLPSSDSDQLDPENRRIFQEGS